ncbi:MAG: LytR C-terminal domain-containing protein, partial [Aeromicrobium sp.]
PSVSEAPVVAPELNPTIAITVLNGTPTAGLANTVGDYLVEQGWGGAATGVGSRANAGASDVEKTVVFYSDPANEAAAKAMVETLAIGEIRLSDDYPTSPITVLIGSDFVPPVG